MLSLVSERDGDIFEGVRALLVRKVADPGRTCQYKHQRAKIRLHVRGKHVLGHLADELLFRFFLFWRWQWRRQLGFDGPRGGCRLDRSCSGASSRPQGLKLLRERRENTAVSTRRQGRAHWCSCIAMRAAAIATRARRRRLRTKRECCAPRPCGQPGARPRCSSAASGRWSSSKLGASTRRSNTELGHVACVRLSPATRSFPG